MPALSGWSGGLSGGEACSGHACVKDAPPLPGGAGCSEGDVSVGLCVSPAVYQQLLSAPWLLHLSQKLTQTPHESGQSIPESGTTLLGPETVLEMGKLQEVLRWV